MRAEHGDGEATTKIDRVGGIVNIEVGFAPLRPGEFAIITFGQFADLAQADWPEGPSIALAASRKASPGVP